MRGAALDPYADLRTMRTRGLNGGTPLCELIPLRPERCAHSFSPAVLYDGVVEGRGQHPESSMRFVESIVLSLNPRDDQRGYDERRNYTDSNSTARSCQAHSLGTHDECA